MVLFVALPASCLPTTESLSIKSAHRAFLILQAAMTRGEGRLRGGRYGVRDYWKKVV